MTPLCAACGACLVAMVFTAELSVVACATTMGLAGFFIAGPDGVIGGPAAKYACSHLCGTTALSCSLLARATVWMESGGTLFLFCFVFIYLFLYSLLLGTSVSLLAENQQQERLRVAS